MTPTELRRAAQDTLNLCLPWDSKEEHYCFPEDSWNDVEALCKHVLSTVREDDGEQVTPEECLLSIKWVVTEKKECEDIVFQFCRMMKRLGVGSAK